MGEASFTPGPWAVSPFRAQVICDRFGKDGDFLPVAQMLWPTDERTEAETYANGRLMAAAPDLYHRGHQSAITLEEAANVLEGKGLPAFATLCRQAAARQMEAIEKANGENRRDA
jgi:hypothetical protein